MAALSIALSACSGGAESQAPPPPPEVTVATPLTQEILDWDDYVGRFEAIEDVEVKPRVSGYLVGLHFRDGQYVRQGQLLFTIDARPARALLDQARAQLARAEAQLVNARTELARSRALAAQKAASVEEVEQRQAALRSAEADVAAAQATVRARQLDVGFTSVEEPLRRGRSQAAEAARIARLRYQYGRESFQIGLDAERTLAETDAALAESEAQLSDDLVSLFLALGGGWQEAPTVSLKDQR